MTQCDPLGGAGSRRTEAAYSSAADAVGGGTLLNSLRAELDVEPDPTVVSENRDLTGMRGSGCFRGSPVICEYIESASTC